MNARFVNLRGTTTAEIFCHTCGENAEHKSRQVYCWRHHACVGQIVECISRHQLEDALFLWFTDTRSRCCVINDDVIIQKAKQLGKRLDVPADFCYSRGWLARFKSRRGISSHRFHGESGSDDVTKVAIGRQQLKQLLANYDPADIYNFDETGLLYKLGPNRTLATGPVSGTKASKERITVGLAMKATGTHKLKPVVVTHAKHTRCFGKTFKPDVYAYNYHNKTAWMISLIFTDSLKTTDRQMKLAGCKILLLLDNATSQKNDVTLSNSWITLMF